MLLDWLNHPFGLIALTAILLVVFEFLELSWQKGELVFDMLLTNYTVWVHQGLFVYLGLHINFLFIVGLVGFVELQVAWSLLLVKGLELLYKFYILDQVLKRKFRKKPFLVEALMTPIGRLRYGGCVIYPLTLFLGL